ncbi:MAG: hypothetical protein B7Z15_01790 [Rhizobiales bacterium 32-66-8]|nr:MAG: hypothetical protein B7Z15_01790 [Rhizobiales bacterium 32-66-8]
MRTLRAKLAGLIAAAILLVVVLATAVSFFLIGRPPRPDDDAVTAAQLSLVLDLLQKAGGSAMVASPLLRTAPPDGMVDPTSSRRLTEELTRLRSAAAPQTRSVSVILLPPAPGPQPTEQADQGQGGGERRFAVMRMPDGRWLVFPLAGLFMPPPSFPLGLAAWLLLVGFGVTGVVVIAVGRLMRPLAIIQEAVEGVGPDGELPALEERGPSEVRAAARTINTLSARLKIAMESRMRIVAAAAHDLRTPLTRLRLRAEFIQDDEEREQWFSDLAELDRIADSAIRLVREEANDTPEERVPLEDLLKSVVAETTQSGQSALLRDSMPATVRGRPLSLKRALGRAVLLIEDDGPGIPEHLMARVFEPFFRTDPARQVTIPGAGLGLAISHEIIQRHGGTLVLSNRAGGGLAQQVSLPCDLTVE